ncbi:UDP-N-acetylmuramoyl-L-alanine--D-glutamate ligase [Ferrimonas sediminicola]|uniref:UDP-N-acetylmuramoylalanine--D-glutamate ligase n=1 Tax=Ferrimonas sediminicola TaxID=2569538 RepID=A0A4U1BMB8_9GAMM|nr:UDP-N-acetylmuramoyl-L-alanine--D-glutamate ligase [Ferrimonas sediminicola]TKB51268.1 UDP-N-acetylmuramoyl-L-alanine--D-glutamate ligase [Ferrimonas sediminicola]
MSQLTVPVRWLILGLGITGLSCVRHLHRRGDTLAVWDSRRTPPGADTLAAEFPGVPLISGPFDAEALKLAQTLVVSPGIPLAHPAIAEAMAAGVEAIGDIELFAREVDAPVVAITGSNGKSTVTTLMGEMAREAGRSVGIGGNIGTPALDLLGRGHDCYVLELSSFQLETTTSLRPRIATVLNVSDDHLDRYRDFGHYRDTKATIYAGAELVLENADDPHTRSGRPDAWRFGLQRGEFRLEGGRLMARERPVLAAADMALVGSHNQANALAAIAMAEALGLEQAPMVKALTRFGGLPHRCETVAVKGGVHYVNDSKATNVGATLAALQGMKAFPGRLHLIAGGVGKGADFSPLAPWLNERVDQLVTLGQDGDAIAALKPGALGCDSLEQGVRMLAERARPGDMVLLSPACASLDMFANYVARGEAFRQAVEAL